MKNFQTQYFIFFNFIIMHILKLLLKKKELQNILK